MSAETDAVPTTEESDRKVGFLVKSALALVSTSFLTSGLGFIYWAAAARFFSASIVGESATAIAAMNLIAPFTTLGLGTLLLSQLPTMAMRRTELVASAAVVSGVFGGVLALVLGVLLPTEVLGLPGIGHDPFATLLFAAGVSAQGIGMVLDAALLSVDGGGPQLRRNATHSVVKLVLVIAFALLLSSHGSLSIYASWFVANVVSIVVMGVWVARHHRVRWSRIRPTRDALAGMKVDAAQHHALNLALQVPYFAMPIVANVTLGSEQAGYLYATWSIAGFVFVLPIALSTALFASGARDTADFLAQFRFTFRYAFVACVAANIVILPLGGLVLQIFGSEYAANGHTTLVLLCIAGLGLIVKDHHVTIARVTGKVGRESVTVWALTALELVGASVGARLNGLTGLAQGWLAAVVIEALVFGPMVWRAYTGRIASSDAVTELAAGEPDPAVDPA